MNLAEFLCWAPMVADRVQFPEFMYHLGVMMGKQLVGPNETNPRGHFEDLEFRQLLYRCRTDGSVIKDLKAKIDARFFTHKLWGVKEPALLEVIMALGQYLQGRNYKLILTQRDPIACTRSYRRKWPNSNVDQVHNHIVNMLEQRKKFIDTYPQEALCIDFNKLTDQPERIVYEIVHFIFGERPHIFEKRVWPSDKQIQSSIDFIEPELNHHLEHETPLK